MKIKKDLFRKTSTLKGNSQNRGITLIALVVTIIILLILAGIAVAQLTGSGVFEKARLAKEKQYEVQEKEKKVLGEYENFIDDLGTVGTRNENENKYSIKEQVIGTWANGSLLYQKTYILENVVSNTKIDTELNRNNIEVVNMFGCAMESNYSCWGIPMSNSYWYGSIILNDDDISFNTSNSSVIFPKFNFTIQYIKK